MAITFVQQKRRQKMMVWLLLAVFLVGGFLIWFFLFRPTAQTDSITISPEIAKLTKKVEINFDSIRSPLKESVPVLSIKIQAEPTEGFLPLKDIDVLISVQGEVVGPFTFKIDCTNDGTYEKEIKDIKDKIYKAVDVCSYSKEGENKLRVYAESQFEYFSAKGEKLNQIMTANVIANISVKSRNNSPVISSCDVSSTEGTTQTGYNFRFSVNATDLDKDPLKYFWNFGDGVSSTEQNPTYNYKKPGNYFPYVVVSDGFGEEAICYPFSLSKLKDFNFFENVLYPTSIKIGRDNPFIINTIK